MNISKYLEMRNLVLIEPETDDISEHIEFAGVHSGDATLVFPAQ